MSDPLSRQIFATELFSLAQSVAAGHGRNFKTGADARLRSMAESAATEALLPSRFGATSRAKNALPIEARKAEARAAVQRLVGAMVAHANNLPGYAVNELGERTLDHALQASGLCPCWPIC